MKRTVWVVIAAVFLTIARYVSADSSVKANPLVKIREKEGSTHDYIGPVYFPDFHKNTGKRVEEDCEDFLKELNGKKMSEYLDSRGFLKSKGSFFSSKNCKYACPENTSGSCREKDLVKCGNSDSRGIDIESGEGKTGMVSADEDDYYDLEGLSGKIEVASGYKKTSKMLFSWTVRVEGYIPKDCDHSKGKIVSGISVWPVLCHPWHGISHQNYAGGQVKTQLYILGAKTADGKTEHKDDEGYVAVGEPVEMTVPLIKSKVKVGSGSDPTLTGSYVLTPGDFSSGEIPDEIEYKLKWANHTALRIKSPKGQRNLVITRMPLTQD